AKTVPEFVGYAKANPGKINMGSAGVGSTLHLSGELFKLMTGVDMVHVPNCSGTQLTDLIGGQVQVVFNPLPSAIELITAGKLRALAVSSASRWPTLPDVPTLARQVSSMLMWGICACAVFAESNTMPMIAPAITAMFEITGLNLVFAELQCPHTRKEKISHSDDEIAAGL